MAAVCRRYCGTNYPHPCRLPGHLSGLKVSIITATVVRSCPIRFKRPDAGCGLPSGCSVYAVLDHLAVMTPACVKYSTSSIIRCVVYGAGWLGVESTAAAEAQITKPSLEGRWIGGGWWIGGDRIEVVDVERPGSVAIPPTTSQGGGREHIVKM